MDPLGHTCARLGSEPGLLLGTVDTDLVTRYHPRPRTSPLARPFFFIRALYSRIRGG